ncbi:M28 family peptidase [uncultured Tenacibaculum sp.]|uniref:M28 family peptidase n=1 Tax=uncultured Tenacibaculum sp. TaxID=174713 RepID=UPI002630B0AC|nr:M28 family peptidase [uncultured Tenacibaculum sp.]
MYKNTLLILLFVISVVSCKKTTDDQKFKTLKSTNYSEILNQEFTGDLAYNTTAFVEKYWRVVGNTGFNKSIYKVAEELEKSGFVKEENAKKGDVLTYRIEKRPLQRPTWESVDASLRIAGKEDFLLQHDTNRNMIALNSYSTPKEGITAEVIYVEDTKNLEKIDVKGKIVFAEVHPYRIFRKAIVEGGAVGLVTYNNPSYLQPEKNTTSIQFRTIPLNEEVKSWGIALSYKAKEALKKELSKGKVKLTAVVNTKVYESEELTIVADIKGTTYPKERLVFSAHVQEPGANDNATGVGVALEMATLTAKFIKNNRFTNKRTLTFLWGDEIVSTRRYVEEDSIRAKDIKWGISLDMVGEDTKKTGGTFLIEKMPDPSAIWTRGKDKHTEWGAAEMKLSQMKPHYLNDFLINKFKAQGKIANWEVNTNPFEGGSDHVPFLKGNIPSVLFWHFTDQFYHTDNDRLDKVSQETLKNVGVGSLTAAYTLLNSDKTTATTILNEIEVAALARLQEEKEQSKIALSKGDSLTTQVRIINAWNDWYVKSAEKTLDMVKDSLTLKKEISKTQEKINTTSKQIVEELSKK